MMIDDRGSDEWNVLVQPCFLCLEFKSLLEGILSASAQSFYVYPKLPEITF